MVKICDVEKGSLAEKEGILPGDLLCAIDSHPIRDVLDYRFFLTEKKITLTLKRDETEFDIVITKDRYDDIGLDFETYLMDQKQRCSNKCIFCFIDQNPCGMRETVYFKDDDTRLSFLMGNYVTLTNVGDEDLERIIKMHLVPVNISVHTTNPDLRCKMLGNRFAGRIMDQMKRLSDGKIPMNVQIVACRGINDGSELVRTLTDLEAFFPYIQSIAVVPAGLTRHRENLPPIAPYDAASAQSVIDICSAFAKKNLERYDTRIVHAADEFYLAASAPLPRTEEYEGFPQLDNGVGLLRNSEDEITEELDWRKEDGSIEAMRKKPLSITLATGSAAFSFMKRMCDMISKAAPNLSFDVVEVKNHFFGESVTVAGLLCGGDILKALEGRKIDILFLPAVSLRHERDKFLDDLTLTQLENKLGCRVYAIENGAPILDTLTELQKEG